MEKQKGFAPILIAVVVVVIAAVAGYFIMGSKGKAGTAGILPKVNLPGVGLNANCELKDPELCKYVDKTTKMMATIDSGFSGRSVTADKTGKKNETVWEMQGNKTHFQSTENGKEAFNTITIGDTTYTKDLTDGKWFKFTAKTGSSSSGGLFNVEEIKNTMQDTIKEMKDSTTYKAMGKAPCGKLTCFKYQIIVASLPSSQEFLYFDDREYMMRMMETSDTYGTTTTYFEYNPVSISAPSPVKEGQGFNLYDPSILEKTAGSASSIDMEKLKQNAEELMKNIQIPQESSSE